MISKKNAIVYCEGAFNTPIGKTAHGLVRFSKLYNVLSVLDSKYAGYDAGDVLDGINKNIPIFASLDQAIRSAQDMNLNPEYFLVGIAPDGGKMTARDKESILKAIKSKLNIVSGLHDFLTADKDIIALAKSYEVELVDIRNPPDRKDLHFFSGKIEEVKAIKIAQA